MWQWILQILHFCENSLPSCLLRQRTDLPIVFSFSHLLPSPSAFSQPWELGAPQAPSSGPCTVQIIYLVTPSQWLVSTHTSFLDDSSLSLIWAPGPYVRMKAAWSSPLGCPWHTEWVHSKLISLSSLSQTCPFPTPCMVVSSLPQHTDGRSLEVIRSSSLSHTQIEFLLLPLPLRYHCPYLSGGPYNYYNSFLLKLDFLSHYPASVLHAPDRVISLEYKFEHFIPVLKTF